MQFELWARVNPHLTSHQLLIFWLWVCNRVCKTVLLPRDKAFWSILSCRPSELKERLKPELLELIRQQRLNRLCQGTMFRKISSRRRQGETAHTQMHNVLKKKNIDPVLFELNPVIIWFPQINCGTAACHQITRCFTTVTWRRTQKIPQSKHFKRRVSPNRIIGNL